VSDHQADRAASRSTSTEGAAVGAEGPDLLAAPVADTGRSAVLVAAGIGLSRLSGLVREVAMAAFLAVGPAADAFRAAFRIPNLLQNLLGEGALSAAFIPVYARLLAEGRREEASKVAGAIAGLLAAATGVIVVFVVVAAGPITAVLAPGFTGETHDLTVQLVQIMTAGIGALVLSAWCLGILNTHRRFFLAYAAPVLWNAAQIAVLVTVGLRGWGEASLAEALAWGVLVGGVLQFLVQLPAVMRLEPGLRPSLRASLPGVRTVLRRFGPAVLGRGVVQLGAYVDLVLASLLAAGAVAALGYAQILYLLPISLFAMSVAAAELPELSRTDDFTGQVERLETGIRRILFFLVFTVVAYLVVGDLIVGALYQRRLFDADDTVLVWLALCGYTVGLLAIGVSRLLQNALFSRGDTKGPAWIAAVRVALAAALGFVLMFQFDQFGVIASQVERLGDLPAALRPLPDAVRDDGTVRLGAVGLSLASGLAAWVELGLLRGRLRRRAGRSPAVALPLARLAPGAAVAVGVLIGVRFVTEWLPMVVSALVTVGAGGAAYVLVARFTGVAESEAVLAPLRRLRR
jgi:putative peptidoglycan lipid II flippase